MITLSNGCYCSQPSVNPKNYNQVTASVKKDWYIAYRFYDPTVLDKNGKIKPYLRIIKGMNFYKNLKDRRSATKELLDIELRRLQVDGFNPITNTFSPEFEIEVGIDPQTKLIKALEVGYNKLEVTEATLRNIKSCRTYIELAMGKMNWSDLRLSDVTRKHIKAILDMCKLSECSYNHYRTYLMMMIKAIDYFEVNPVEGVPKKAEPKRIRPVMVRELRQRVEEHYREADPVFLNFLHIFFHSGAREIELLRLQKEHVDLKNKRFIVAIRKGGSTREVHRPIKDIVFPLWEHLISQARTGQYLFGIDFQPDDKPCKRDYLTRKWNSEVKDDKTGLKIKADLYTLKHANLDETAELLSLAEASKMAGHTTPVITLDYAQGEKERQADRLRKVNNPFA
ncbi:MAG: hypothetical protein V4450_07530 [Bacteroidota bacterium]